HTTAVVDGRVDDLLHAMHVARETRDDDAARGLRHHLVDDRADLALGRREAGYVGVGRVGQKEVDALLAELREVTEVGDAAVERQLIHLEVARVQHEARLGAYRDREGVRNRVVDGDEFEAEAGDLAGLALAYDVRDRRDPVLLELRGREGERELRAIDRDVFP